MKIIESKVARLVEMSDNLKYVLPKDALYAT